MNSVPNKTRLAEKQKTKKTTKIQNKKQYELNKRRSLLRKQNESNKEIIQNERRQERQNLIDEDIDMGRFYEFATSDKKYVSSLNSHEIKNEIFQEYTGNFEINGLMITGHVEHKTNLRFKSMDDFESYINAIDVDYDSENGTFTGYIYELNTLKFKDVKRSAYGKGTNYMQESVEHHGQNCFIPTSVHCFIKCINCITKKDYTEDF